MGRHRTSRVITSPTDMRAVARRGEWHGSTGGHCPAYQQANLVILPQEAALEFVALPADRAHTSWRSGTGAFGSGR